MRSPEPSIPRWLLTRFGVSEALVGDLSEQYSQGRSRLWYWRQGLVAIGAGAFTDIRSHKGLALRGVIVGFILGSLFARMMYPLAYLDQWLFVTGLAEVREWWPDHQLLMAVLPLVGCFGIGWIVVRWHGMSTVVLLVATVVVVDALWLSVLIVVDGPRIDRLWNAQMLRMLGVLFVENTIGLLVGGLWGAAQGHRGSRLTSQ